ncbi:TnpV protein [Christensenella timonensis]|uniref:TnpV protein n=1 Tax=Christensenella timonensis TaxID=1816678 RepID=UPI00082A6006|nr:TnpV protein [Christensenella timonensis]
MIELDYMEEADGTLRPLLEVKETILPLTKYGLMRKKFLEEQMSAVYLSLQVTDSLYRHCREVEARAQDMKERLKKDLREVSKPPETEDFMEMVAYQNGIDHQAEEMVLKEIVYSKEIPTITMTKE